MNEDLQTNGCASSLEYKRQGNNKGLCLPVPVPILKHEETVCPVCRSKATCGSKPTANSSIKAKAGGVTLAST